VRFDGAKADRYRLHETVRAYARAKLADSGEVARTSMRHLDHYLELAETAAPHLTSHGQLEWLASLELEHDNLRVALSVGVTGAPLRALQLCLALQCFWRFSGPADEGVEPLARLLKTSSQIPPAQRGEALAALSALLIEVGEVAQAWDRAAEAVEIARAERDHSVEGRALSVMAFAAFRQGKNDDAIALSDRAVELARWCNDVDLLSNSLNTRGILAACTAGGDIDSAFASLREAYDLCVASGHAVRLGAVLNNLGYAALSCGARTLARGYLNEALSKADLDPRSANAVENMAFLEFLDGDRQAARELFVNAFWTARREGDENQLAYALLGFALTSESPEVSVRIHAAADVIIRERGEAYEAVEAEVRASDHERLRTLLGSERFEALYETGSSLGRDEVMTLALG
jgi:tetratricopeptide (TPR) repeat protein